jgi:hypothetical protein
MGRVPRAGYELLDLGGNRLGVPHKGQTVASRQLDEAGTGDPVSGVAARADVHGPVRGPVQDQRRHANLREDLAHVDLGDHPQPGQGRPPG